MFLPRTALALAFAQGQENQWVRHNFLVNLSMKISLLLTPFVPNAHFLYPLKTSENRKGALRTNRLIPVSNSLSNRDQTLILGCRIHLKWSAL